MGRRVVAELSLTFDVLLAGLFRDSRVCDRSQPPRRDSAWRLSFFQKFDTYSEKELSFCWGRGNNRDPNMQLLGLIKLDDFQRKHADARGPLDAWRIEVARAQWAGPQDIKSRYPSASFLADNKVIFNIKGNAYRLVIKAKYQNGVVLIEWVGTHAEYDKLKF